ncbi:hypothetical protein EVAR_11449_1 [Eumeta japonica]|uniref:Uncharacterized protein n=1 Tax=Eumeta variegata TaxID=151549 RepID=A0A4C1TKX0_EUMVA|nr:hypothetical protein EVAR_11449_1 [Eumeta japonica]
MFVYPFVHLEVKAFPHSFVQSKIIKGSAIRIENKTGSSIEMKIRIESGANNEAWVKIEHRTEESKVRSGSELESMPGPKSRTRRHYE